MGARRSKDRREPSRADQALRGLVALAVTGALLTLLTFYAKGTLSSNPRMVAKLDDTGAGLTVGSDVKYAGVIIGRVDKLDAGEGGATLELKLERHQLVGIPDNIVARVLPATVFGNTYVDLIYHGKPSTRRLKDGDVVEQDSTQETLELQRALDDIDGLVKALGPADLNIALSAIALALDDRGEQIGQTIDLANELTGRLNQQMPAIREDLQLFATNVEILQRNAPELMDAVEDGLVLARTVTRQEADLSALLTGGLALAVDAERFIDQHGRDLVQAIQQTYVVADAAYDNRDDGIVKSFNANTLLADRVRGSVKQGKIVVDVGLSTAARPYYTAADCPRYGNLRGNC